MLPSDWLMAPPEPRASARWLLPGAGLQKDACILLIMIYAMIRSIALTLESAGICNGVHDQIEPLVSAADFVFFVFLALAPATAAAPFAFLPPCYATWEYSWLRTALPRTRRGWGSGGGGRVMRVREGREGYARVPRGASVGARGVRGGRESDGRARRAASSRASESRRWVEVL